MFFESLLLATGNRHKYEEFLELLPREHVGKLIFASEVSLRGGYPDVEETGVTYAMNAVLKAQAWALASGLPSLADDSGIEVEALSWRPGIYSARAIEGSDADRNHWLLTQMKGQSDRRAHFVAAVALAIPEKWTIVCEGVVSGFLGEGETGVHGFGYDPLFIPDGYEISFGELPSSVKNKISHRARAVDSLFAILKEVKAGYQL